MELSSLGRSIDAVAGAVSFLPPWLPTAGRRQQANDELSAAVTTLVSASDWKRGVFLSGPRTTRPEPSLPVMMVLLTSGPKLRRVPEAFALLRNGVFSDATLADAWDAADGLSLQSIIELDTAPSTAPPVSAAGRQAFGATLQALRFETNQWQQIVDEDLAHRGVGADKHGAIADPVVRRSLAQRACIHRLRTYLRLANDDVPFRRDLDRIRAALLNFTELISEGHHLHPRLVAEWISEPHTIRALLSTTYMDLASMVSVRTSLLFAMEQQTASSSVPVLARSRSLVLLALVLAPGLSIERPKSWGPLLAKPAPIPTTATADTFDLDVSAPRLTDMRLKLRTILYRSLVHGAMVQQKEAKAFVLGSLWAQPVAFHPVVAAHCSADSSRMLDEVEIEALVDVLAEVEARVASSSSSSTSSTHASSSSTSASSAAEIREIAAALGDRSLRTIVVVPNSTQQLNCWSRVLASRLATRPLALFTITIVPPAFDVLSYLLRLSSLDDTCSFVLVAPAPPAALLLSDFSASLESLQGSLDGRSAAEFALLRRALSLAVPPPPPPGGLADPLAAGQVRTIEPFYVSSR